MRAVLLATVLMGVVLIGIPISCQKDDIGDLIVSGKVIDKDTKEGLPNVWIKVDGVTQFGLGRRTESGSTLTNTDGTFNVSIKSIENAAFYDFFANWGSSGHYTEETDYHGEYYLDSITKHKIPMLFELSKIEPLRIYLKNTDPINDADYVGLYFYSATIGFLRVKTIENFGIGNLKYASLAADNGIRTEWLGANVNSVINGNILVNEELTIIVTIIKDGQLTEVVKVVNGKRNGINEVRIDY